MNISEILSLDNIYAEVRANNKRQLLQELSEKAAQKADMDERLVIESVWERENLGSTGYGNGTAFPHARISGLAKTQVMFARLANPVDFNAIDNKPVDLVFLLISPENSGADHLTALAALSRILKNPDACTKLRSARGKEEIYSILTD